MKKSFLVIGLGRYGKSLAVTLSALGHEVLAIDRREQNINDIKDSVLRAVIADATDEHVLIELGVQNFDCVAICIGDDLRASILTTVLCREHGAKKIIAKAQDALHAKLLLKTGADSVIQPEHESGVRLARALASESVIDALDISDEFSIHEIRVPKYWIGKTLSGLAVRTAFGVSVIALRRNGQVIVHIDPSAPFEADDALFVIGDNKKLEKLED